MKLLFETINGKKVLKEFENGTLAKNFIIKNKDKLSKAQILNELEIYRTPIRFDGIKKSNKVENILKNVIPYAAIFGAMIELAYFDVQRTKENNELINQCQIESAYADTENNVINVKCKTPYDMEKKNFNRANGGDYHDTIQVSYLDNGKTYHQKRFYEYNIKIYYNEDSGHKVPVSLEIKPNDDYSIGSKKKVAKIKEHGKIYNVVEKILEDGVN